MTDEPPFLVKQGQLQEEAVKWLYYNLPETGWETADLTYCKAGPVGESVAELTYSDGRVEPFAPPREFVNALMELRDFMATLGKGAWLSAHLTVNKSGSYHWRFNHDDRPPWRMPPTDEAYLIDLQKYPRPPEAMPEWYRELVNK